MFKFTLTITTSTFLFMSGTADLFAMDPLYDDHDKTLATINHMPKDVMGLILKETSKDVTPRLLITICKHWYGVMREDNIPQMAELHYSATNILDSTMNPFMQKCMNTYWENQFYNGTLQYTPTDGREGVTLKFSGLNKDGTFDLSACGDTGQYLVITENMDRFFKVEEENKDKTVIGNMPCYRILQEIKNSPNHPLFPLMAHLNPDKAPAVLLWRWGNEKNLAWVDYLTTASMSKISTRNLYDWWRDGRRWVPAWTVEGARIRGRMFMSVFKPK